MIILPCSIKHHERDRNRRDEHRWSRAPPTWCCKEKRRLVLGIRETPLHGGHLRTLDDACRTWAPSIAPIVPAFYNKPKSGR